jgi:hypothetical protein
VEGDLEEITLGEHRILLEAGQYAYLAVVLKGIEPPGYNERIHEVIHSINMQHERALSGFIGDMHALPDLKPALAPLLPSETIETRAAPRTQPLSRSQKWAAGAVLIGIPLTLAIAVFACVFTVRLWPYAFAAQPPAPTQTSLPVVILPTQTPAPTITLTASPTSVPSQTPSPSPTQTTVPSPTLTLTPGPTQRTGIALGNLNVREGPGTGFPAIGVLLSGQEFTILDEEGEWLHVSIELENGETQTGWVWNRFVDLQAGG